jgi:hypothetical protein
MRASAVPAPAEFPSAWLPCVYRSSCGIP